MNLGSAYGAREARPFMASGVLALGRSRAREASLSTSYDRSAISAAAASSVTYQGSGADALVDSATSETSHTGGQRFLDEEFVLTAIVTS
jgi:hypothetical protein